MILPAQILCQLCRFPAEAKVGKIAGEWRPASIARYLNGNQRENYREMA